MAVHLAGPQLGTTYAKPAGQMAHTLAQSFPLAKQLLLPNLNKYYCPA